MLKSAQNLEPQRLTGKIFRTSDLAVARAVTPSVSRLACDRRRMGSSVRFLNRGSRSDVTRKRFCCGKCRLPHRGFVAQRLKPGIWRRLPNASLRVGGADECVRPYTKAQIGNSHSSCSSTGSARQCLLRPGPLYFLKQFAGLFRTISRGIVVKKSI